LSKEARWHSPDDPENGFNPGELGFNMAFGFDEELPKSIGHWTIEKVHAG
jgi:hypothetical protein